MHELSVVESLLEIVEEAVAEHGEVVVTKLTLQIGSLAAVVDDALRFAFELATADTRCEGASLEVVHVPVTVYCDRCQSIQPLKDLTLWNCPVCGELVSKILTGRELDLLSLEIEDYATADR